MGLKFKLIDGKVRVEYRSKKLRYNLVIGFIKDYGDLGFTFCLEYSLYALVNFQRFPTLDAKKLVNAPKMSAHHRGICHF